MRQDVRRVGGLIGAVMGAIVLSTTTFDQAFAQRVDAGHQIAKTWCVGCHLIDRTSQGIANDATPSFVSIAEAKTTTATGLEVFLSTPHAKMPDYTLTRDEIRNVSAYIMSLKPTSSAPR